MLLVPHLQAITQERTITALMEFKWQIEGGNNLLESWEVNNSAHYCKWEGVSCDHRGQDRVVGISLSGFGLQGTISSSLSNLTFLSFLDLSQNAISGPIPPFPHRLQILYLSQNNLSGSIPSELANCTQLQALDLSHNNLLSSIPPSLSSLVQLQQLELFHNRLSGAIPSQLANCTQLQDLSLSDNTLSESIPAALRNLPELKYLALYSNNLIGSIPAELGNCSSLFSLDLSNECSYSGFLPSALGNCSGLQLLYLNGNKLQGSIPKELSDLTNLEQLYLTKNYLSGGVPPSLGKLVFLQELFLNYNNLTGNIPESFSNLSALSTLDLGYNAFTGSIPWGLGFLAGLKVLSMIFNNLSGTIPLSLANCTKFRSLELNVNQLNGPLPSFIARFPNLYLLNLSVNHLTGHLPETFANATAICTMYMAHNKISGSIPSVFGRLVNLQRLNLQGNHLNGPIPAELGNCVALSELDLEENMLHGPLPPQLGKLSFLRYLHLQGNELQGSIPDSLGKCSILEDLDLSHNNFSGLIPLSLFTLSSLHSSLVLSHNLLTGTIPDEFGNLQHIQVLDFSSNKLSGIIPPTLVKCVELMTLNLSHNKLQGQIPKELGELMSLVSLDLSTNLLTGQIPVNLLQLNVTASSFADNAELCGPPLVALCSELDKPTRKRVPRSTIFLLACGIVGVLIIACGLFLWYRRHRSLAHKKRRLHQGGFADINLIGSGGTSKVYKATLREGLVVAVKKFNWEDKLDKADYFFHKECNTLGKMRHRNLVRILSTCCNLKMKALVLEYMPNGSLEKLLFENDRYQLKWRRLMDIALDVAQALVYLHHECDPSIIHCDLKPSNILLDEVYTAHVSDFGIARILSPGNNSYSASYFRGSIGYIAPECAELTHNSVKGDIYSYGMVLLCMLTGRQPTSEVFYEQGIEMPNWVKRLWPDKYLVALNPTLRLGVEAGNKQKEAFDLMELALSCTAQAPKQRPTSKEIVRTLLHIKSPHHRSAQLPILIREMSGHTRSFRSAGHIGQTSL
ncbi:hypothetical protein GOP47_0007049 [Adiantum capillus-veneris]|uniref:non-specific serine/threonine protein kinase n=1 Tax=Adiantum capillus-veneris TaxID=13818 RepID=A0A9D4V0K8_ADICA|nr:hypothetical protein GOP47_0007049 [Adiantum capillus-veneris]